MNNRYSSLIVWLSVLIFICFLFSFINNDFWQDEIYTITHFVFVPVKTTLTDYHTTNNHILFSLLANLYRTVFGWNNITGVMNDPFLLRIIPVLFSLLNVFVLYKLTNKYYGKTAALLAVSFWATTISIVDFGAQFRGYSLNILICTIQYFYFFHVIKKETIGLRTILALCLTTAVDLLVMPTNIYLVMSYLLFCGIVFLKPSISLCFVNKTISRANTFKIGCAIAAGTAICSLYYKWLLELQAPIEYLNHFTLFNVQDIRAAFGVFYHFTAYRYYVYFFLLAYVVMITRLFLLKHFVFSQAFLPGFLFFVPFIFFVIHGALYFDRIFLFLMPVFILLITLTTVEVYKKITYKYFVTIIMSLNIICVIISFIHLRNVSIRDNRQSLHEQYLLGHYYLVNFNAREVTLQAKQLCSNKKIPLYLCDYFGGTGIDYYLRGFHVPYKKCDDSLNITSDCVILANNKKDVEEKLSQKKITFQKMLSDEYQFNLFYCTFSK